MLVDSGDLLSVGSIVPDNEIPSLIAKGEVYMKTYTKMGYVAQGVGDRDLKLVGVEGLKTIQSKGAVPFVCANLVDKDGKPVFLPYVVVEKLGFRFVFFGLLPKDTTFNETAFPKEQGLYKIESPVDTAKKYLPEIQKLGATATFVLAHMERGDIEALTKEVPGFDLYFAGQGMAKSNFVERLSNAWFVEGGQRGQVLNVLVMHLNDKAHKEFVVREIGQKLKEEVQRLDAQIERYSKVVAGPAKAGTRGENKDRFKKMVADLMEDRKALAAKVAALAAPAADSPFLSLESAEILKDFPDQPEILAWIDAYEKAYPPPQPKPHPGNALARPVPPKVLPQGGDAKGLPKVPAGVIKPGLRDKIRGVK